jgi:hypothetical protein
MKRGLRFLLTGGSLVVVAIAANTETVVGANCHACLSACASFLQEEACDTKCGGAEPAEYWDCFDDEWEFCTEPLELITECVRDN